jgi:hypothetical protein
MKPILNIVWVGILCFFLGFTLALFYQKYSKKEGFLEGLENEDDNSGKKDDLGNETDHGKKLDEALIKMSKKMNKQLFDNTDNYKLIIDAKKNADEDTQDSIKKSLVDFVQKFSKMYYDGFGEPIPKSLKEMMSNKEKKEMMSTNKVK